MAECDDRVIGTHLGRVKWFSNKLGYGFITYKNNWSRL